MHDSSRISFAASGIFSNAPAELIAAIDTASTSMSVEAGACLFQRGDPGDALYAIGEGCIQIETSAADGRGRVLNLMRPGDIFGEVAMLDGGERTADASALQDCRLQRLSRDAFLRVLEAHPGLARHLIEALCRRLRRISTQAEDSAFLDIAGRLARRLLELSAEGQTEVRISQEEMARHIGASRVSVNQHLQGWRARDWVEVRRGRVLLKNRAALERYLERRLDAARWGTFA